MTRKIKRALYILFRAILRICYRCVTFFANRYSINLPAQLVEVDSNQISYQQFVAKFSGKEIMRIISPKDSVLYHEFLYRDSENLIIIGGFKGSNLNRFEYLRNLNTFHVYEPNPEFASLITSNISNLIVHVEAVGQHDGSALLRVSGDHSYLDSVERPSSINISEVKSVKVVSISTALSRLVGQYSMFLNCEGGSITYCRGCSRKWTVWKRRDLARSFFKVIK